MKYVLVARWSEQGPQGRTHEEAGEPFSAGSNELALQEVQRQYPFMKGLPWYFAGKRYELELREPVRVGEEFKFNARNYD